MPRGRKSKRSAPFKAEGGRIIGADVKDEDMPAAVQQPPAAVPQQAPVAGPALPEPPAVVPNPVAQVAANPAQEPAPVPAAQEPALPERAAENEMEIFFKACQAGDIATVKLMIDNGIDLKALEIKTNLPGITHALTSKGHLGVLMKILQKIHEEPKPPPLTTTGKFLEAINSGDIQTVKAMLDDSSLVLDLPAMQKDSETLLNSLASSGEYALLGSLCGKFAMDLPKALVSHLGMKGMHQELSLVFNARSSALSHNVAKWKPGSKLVLPGPSTTPAVSNQTNGYVSRTSRRKSTQKNVVNLISIMDYRKVNKEGGVSHRSMYHLEAVLDCKGSGKGTTFLNLLPTDPELKDIYWKVIGWFGDDTRSILSALRMGDVYKMTVLGAYTNEGERDEQGHEIPPPAATFKILEDSETFNFLRSLATSSRRGRGKFGRGTKRSRMPDL